MERPIKIFVGVLGVVILCGVATVSLMQLAQFKRQLASKQQMIASLTMQNEEFQQQLLDLEAEREDLQQRLGSLRSQLSSSTNELGQLRGVMAELQARYDAAEEGKTYLEKQVSQLTKERDEARESLRKLEADKAELARAAARLRERLALLDRDYQRVAEKLSALEQERTVPYNQPAPAAAPGESSVSSTSSYHNTAPAPGPGSSLPGPGQGGLMPQTVELPPIVVRKDQAGRGLAVHARVVEINQTHRFIVIDKGANEGIRVGMAFDIFRGSGPVAQAVTIRVRPQLAACEIVGSRSPEFPQVGDRAIQRGP